MGSNAPGVARIQSFTDLTRQDLGGKSFCNERKIRLENSVMRNRVSGVPGHEEALCPGAVQHHLSRALLTTQVGSASVATSLF